MYPNKLETQTATPKGERNLWPKITLILAAFLLLAVGALIGPALIQNAQAGAAIAPPAQTAPISLFEDQNALADLYDQVLPSVVNIQVVATPQAANLPEGFQLPKGFELPQGAPKLRGQGSGFIWDDEGHIITNNHVVENAESVTVVFSNGYWADAEVVATDPQADLAVIKVTPPEGVEWKPLPRAEAGSLRVGHMVIAIGNPFGLAGTMTTGIVSALERSLPVGEMGQSHYTLPDLIQTDAAINPGNSGGPLLDLNGQVVGVNFAIESPGRFNSGVGFAIPMSIVNRVVPALIENGKYEYAYLGLSGSTITPEIAKALGLDNTTRGVYVAEVLPGGPSEKAGLQGATGITTDSEGNEIQTGGDIITAIDGEPVVIFEDLVNYLVTQASPGQTVTLDIIRDGKPMQVEATLGTRPEGQPQEEQASKSEGVNAREAMDIAIELVTGNGELKGQIVEKVVTPDERDGQPVWVVKLSTADQTATVVVDKATGDVLEMSIAKSG